MKKTLSLLALLFFAVATSFAGDALTAKKIVASNGCRFRSNEWHLDISTVGSAGIANGQGKQGLGGNLGVSYFFLKYFGIGLDNSVGSTRNAGMTGLNGLQADDGLQGDLLFRYPMCAWNIAPYAMVGGGGHWGPSTKGDGNVGGGLEYRITENIGLFADCRWLYGTELSMAVSRVGLRFAF